MKKDEIDDYISALRDEGSVEFVEEGLLAVIKCREACQKCLDLLNEHPNNYKAERNEKLEIMRLVDYEFRKLSELKKELNDG